MSRLALALRKASAAGHAGAVSRQEPSMWDDVRGPFGGADVPWDFTGSRADTQVRLAAGAAQRNAAARRAGIAPETGSDEDMAALIRRVYEPGPAPNRRRAILFSAVDADSASTRISARVAAVLSGQQSGSVCLVEANLRSPDTFGGDALAHGLSEMLLGYGAPRSLAVPVLPNLWLLPAGNRGREVVERLTAEQWRPRLHELRAAFDYLVVNAAPANVHRDAAKLAPLLDGVVIVVSASATRREAARRTVADLQQSGANVLGAVLSDRRFPIPEAIYRRI